MSPRFLFQQLRIYAWGTQRLFSKDFTVHFRIASQRNFTSNEKPLPQAEKSGPGPNQTQLGHVSEEAAVTDRITGDQGPDLDQGTPIQEV